MLCGLAIARALATEAHEFPEYKIKAVYIYNFAKFVAWPEQAWPDPKSPLVIGILGQDPFGPLLAETIKGKTVNGRSLVLRKFKSGAPVDGCHILFVSRSEKERLPAILASLRGKNVLVISELERFTRQGGMINFVIAEDRVRFELNLQAAQAAGLQVSSKLCEVGILVKPEPEKQAR